MGWLRRPFSASKREDFWALRDIDLDVARGEVLGVIGHNGAGKSTLLKLLARITYPTAGRIELFGRIGSLLEVGTGFHPELTGRENIYLNGAILGMRRAEVARRYDEIVEFAGVERFLDTPVKRYSSGMYVRLAFAVAAHLDTEILVVDEVLAVGDGAFQRRSLGKMGEAARSGRTVLVVSHNVAVISTLASSCVVLEHGSVSFRGSPVDAIAHYMTRVSGVTAAGSFEDAQRWDIRSAEPAGRIQAGWLDSELGVYDAGTAPRIRLTIHRLVPIAKVCVRVTIQRANGESVGTTFSGAIDWPDDCGRSDYIVDLVGVALLPGRYFFEIELRDVDSRIYQPSHDCLQQVLPFEVAPIVMGNSVEQWPPTWGSASWDPPVVTREPSLGGSKAEGP
ncbi:MAG TPA: polysaccharide ABC transporter ATP-binding protein [Mycobacteriales bacterium]|nr:polysaccharide ABC transporter ATP-binding protein [Mycobacteriales bacterium]